MSKKRKREITRDGQFLHYTIYVFNSIDKLSPVFTKSDTGVCKLFQFVSKTCCLTLRWVSAIQS